jgi:cyclase
MLRVRVVPALLLRGGGLVKGSRFADHRYVGDPINAVKIFNQKEADELLFLDIGATRSGIGPNMDLLRDIATEAFMPFGYGGGVSTPEQIAQLISIGVEKVVINSAALDRPGLIREAADLAGSSSIVVSIDARRSLLGRYEVVSRCGTHRTGRNPADWAAEVANLGAGEILITAVDREGSMSGYDLDLVNAVDAGAAAVSAGSFFVFHGRHRAVLITYPEYRELQALFSA